MAEQDQNRDSDTGKFVDGNEAARKYDEELHPKQIIKLAELGATDREIADFLEISVVTLYRWRNTHEPVCNALKKGKAPADDRVERSLYQKSVGFPYIEERAIKVKDKDGNETVEVVPVELYCLPDTTSMIFWLKNRRRDEWRDKQDHEHTGKDGAPITVTTAVKHNIVEPDQDEE